MKILNTLFVISLLVVSMAANAGIIDTFSDIADDFEGDHLTGSVLDDDVTTGYTTFWPHGSEMNRTGIFSWDGGVTNGEGDDLAFFINSTDGWWGRTVSITVNGVSIDVTADIPILQTSATDTFAGVWAGLVDFSDLNVAENGQIFDVSFNAAMNIGTYGDSNCNNFAAWGNCSDVNLAGISAITVPAPVPASLILFGLAFIGLRRARTFG